MDIAKKSLLRKKTLKEKRDYSKWDQKVCSYMKTKFCDYLTKQNRYRFKSTGEMVELPQDHSSRNITLRDVMPLTWSCPEGNKAGIVLDDDGITLYTSLDNERESNSECNYRSGVSGNQSRNRSKPITKFALVAANKPIPMDALVRKYTSQDNNEQQNSTVDQSSNSSSTPLHHTQQQTESATKKFFYFEITVTSGVACMGLVPIGSVRQPSSTCSPQHPYPVIFDLIPGSSPNSIGLSSDGNLHIAGSTPPFQQALSQPHSVDSSYLWNTLGCAWQIGGCNQVFFTKNGDIVESNFAVETSISTSAMIPVVSLYTEGTTIVGNFGENPFVYHGHPSFELVTIHNRQIPPSLHSNLSNSPVSDDEHNHLNRHIEDDNVIIVSNSTSSNSKINRDEHERNIAMHTNILGNQSYHQTLSGGIITKEQMEEAKDYARELRCLKSTHDPDVISSMEEIVRIALQRVQFTIEQSSNVYCESIDIVALLDLNEFLNDALDAAKLIRKPLPVVLQTVSCLQHQDATTNKSNNSLHPPSVPSESKASDVGDVPTLVNNKDIFSLICMLRGHTGDRLEAAKALMGIAKDEGLAADGASKLRDQIRSSGGMHSLLTLFKSSKDNSEMKLATALGVAYLIPAFTDPTHCQGDLGLREMECLRFLVNSPVIPDGSDLGSHKVREVAALALTHLWINVLQPTWSEGDVASFSSRATFMSSLGHQHNKTSPNQKDSSSNASSSTSSTTTISYFSNRTFGRAASIPSQTTTHSSRLVDGRWRRLKQRQDMLEMQELLETTVSLVVTVADSEIDYGCTSECGEDLRYNAAVTVESLCAVEFARPIVVREGMLKVLVRWLSSDNVELVRPAANALRDLTSLHDEYMAGWIHSQIVNEGTLPVIVKLAISCQRDIRLAVAQILASLSVAPHTRAAIVDAKGLSYLVQLVVDSAHELPGCEMDEPLALAAGSALLRIAAGAMNHTSGWMRPSINMKKSFSQEDRDNIIHDIIKGGALGPFVTMAKSEYRGKLRLMSVEALRIISEDVRVGQSTRQNLCNAGAAFACGTVLKQDISILYSMLQPKASQSEVDESNSDMVDCDSPPERAPLLELYHALHALANMLEPSSQQEEEALSLVVKFGDSDFQSTACQDTLVSVCMQTAESGGVESLLWMASLPVATAHFPQSSYISTVDPNELLVEAYRTLASLCPLLLSSSAASKGFAKWAGHVLLALTGVLKREVIIDQGERVEMVRELQLDALRGLSSLAEYEPLKVMIIDESLPQLLQFKNDRGDINELSQLANQVCLALGFSEEEMDIQLAGNDPKLLADWFCLEQSLIIQAMARDEIRLALFKAWGHTLKDIRDLTHSKNNQSGNKSAQKVINSLKKASKGAGSFSMHPILESEDFRETSIQNESSYADTFTLLRIIFENLSDDETSASLRNTMLQQYANIYENHVVGEDDENCTAGENDSFAPLPARGSIIGSSNSFVAPGEMMDDDETVVTMATGTSTQTFPSTNRSIYSRSPSVKVYDDPRRDRIGTIGAHPYPMKSITQVREWILAHRRATVDYSNGSDILIEPHTNASVPLPVRVQNLLDLYFPSYLIQSEILPLADLSPDASFDFRALAMPERRYFSFRREGQILSRICEKHASSMDLDDVYWTLGFSNSSFAGEFAETLVQALYRCPVIQSVSFSRNSDYSALKRSVSTGSTHHHSDDDDDDGSTLLAYLAGSLPPWVTSLTFDNVLSKNAIHALVDILETMGQRSVGSNGVQFNVRRHNREIESHFPITGHGQNSHIGYTYGVFNCLAIRNSPQLTGDALTPFFRLLGFKSTPPRGSLYRPPLLSLRVLDLSGNKLSDSCSAAVLKIPLTETSASSLESLDLSDNNIKDGTSMVQVLRDYVHKHRLSQRNGVAARHDTWCSRLRALNLASNQLHCGNLVTEMVYMLENDVLTFKALNFADNCLSGEGNLFDILNASLQSNTKLMDLNLSENCFSHIVLDNLMQKIIRGGSSWPSQSFLHLDGNMPSLNDNHVQILERFTSSVRNEQVKQHFIAKQCQASQNSELIKDNGNNLNSEDLEMDPFSHDYNSTSSNYSSEDSGFFSENFSHSQSGNSDVSSNLTVSTTKRHYRHQFEKGENQVGFKADTGGVNLGPDDQNTLSNFQRDRKIGTRSGREGNKITVLFSAPLVWKDRQNSLRPIEMLDFELERELLWQCFKEASMDIELSFDNATTDRLQATMTKCCGCLHYSGHGNPNYLTFEDGKGGLHWLEVNQLKDLMSNGVKGGGAPFRFVFVSACHSSLAGETFVNAGVPHVVCCQQESQLMDSAALAFTRAFYLALAIGRTVKDSFEIGRQAVAVAPSVPDSEHEMKKFVLLPKNGKHDVPIFDAEPIPEWPNTLNLSLSSSRRNIYQRSVENGVTEQALPTPPQGFLGREVDMYKLLNEVLTKRFVSLVGRTGIGRSSLASAVCHYVNDRKSTMIAIETIYYVRAKSSRGSDRFGSFIRPLHKQLVAEGKALSLQKSSDLDDVFQSIFTALSKTKALIVFDRAEALDGSIEAQDFPLFLSSLFRDTRNVRVLLTARKPLGLSSLRGVGEHVVTLGPLNFKSTVRLFAILCPHVHTGEERRKLLELLVPEEQAQVCASDDGITKRSRKIIEILGNGVPSQTFDVAYKMTKKEYHELLQHGQNQDGTVII